MPAVEGARGGRRQLPGIAAVLLYHWAMSTVGIFVFLLGAFVTLHLWHGRRRTRKRRMRTARGAENRDSASRAAAPLAVEEVVAVEQVVAVAPMAEPAQAVASPVASTAVLVAAAAVVVAVVATVQATGIRR